MRLWLQHRRRRGPTAVTFVLLLLVGSDSGLARRRVNRAFLKMFQAEAAAQTDPCHDDETDKPRQCVPDFVNAAYGVNVRASSTCGSPPSRHCHAAATAMPQQFLSGSGGGGGKISAAAGSGTKEICEICDSAHPARKHPPEYLTDLNNPNNQTCWTSELLSPDTNNNNNVTLVLSLGKKYELTYISLQFCHQKPHSMAIYKSMDHGKSWQPFQFYSANCRAVWNREHRVSISRANEQEALCLDSHLAEGTGSRVAFSTLADRPSAEDFENSPVLQDWVTATDIKIVFPVDRLAAAPGGPNIKRNVESNAISAAAAANQSDPIAGEDEVKNDLAARQYISVSDLAIGGRCKCNGHASQCKLDKYGELACDCQHNTDGRECEKCKPFHFDRPWGRATSSAANECVACSCNLHARRCRFNMELYRLSGGVSGGVCYKCRHNTAGRHCHYCKEGYFRNADKPMTHKKACRPCNCHPVGSSGKICNQTSGQCPCKDGVTGLECNRCAKGYQQSGSPIAPCIKVPKTAAGPAATYSSRSGYSAGGPPPPSSPAESPTGGHHRPQGDARAACSHCNKPTRKVNMRKYCKQDYVLLVTLGRQAAAAEGKWLKFSASIDSVFRKSEAARGLQQQGPVDIWVARKDVECGCPKLRPRTTYLMLGQDASSRRAIVVKSKTVVLEWKEEWRRRMKRFQRRSRKYCPEQ
jgi:netrin receptor unc-5